MCRSRSSVRRRLQPVFQKAQHHGPKGNEAFEGIDNVVAQRAELAFDVPRHDGELLELIFGGAPSLHCDAADPNNACVRTSVLCAPGSATNC